MTRQETNRLRARRLWVLSGPPYGPHADRAADLACFAMRAALGVRFDQPKPHWCIQWDDSTETLVRGRSGEQATRRLFRLLRRRPWVSYGTV